MAGRLERVASAPPSSKRASDAERDRTVARLRAAYAEGRIDGDELEDRCAAAMRARDRRDLRLLTRDLPLQPPRPKAGTLARLHRAAVRVHATAYVAGNGSLVAVWAAAGADDLFWPGFALVPTSALLAAHAIGVPAAARALQRGARRRLGVERSSLGRR